MDEVTERTDGAVQFEAYYDASLCEGAESLICVGDGRADIGFATPIYNPAEFRLMTLGSLMFLSGNSKAVAASMNEFYWETPELQAEFEATNTRPLYFAHSNTPLLFTVDPIQSIDDLQGLSIRGVGNMNAALADLGANPVATETSEMYESLQRGVLDGAVGVLDSVGRLIEVVNHAYDLGEYTGSYALMNHVINADVWAGLDPEVRDVMNEVSAELVASGFDEFFLPLDERDCRALIEEVESIESLAPSDAWEEWAATWGQGEIDNWSAKAREAGAENPEELAGRFQDVIREYEDQVSYTSIGTRCRELAMSS